MLQQLQQKYANTTGISFSQSDSGLTFIHVANDQAQAKVCVHGGHVCEFQPIGEKPVIWMSEDVVYKEGKAIRGGVPVCWPWFGPHSTDTSLPQHGFARNQHWTIAHIENRANGQTLVELILTETDSSLAIWPHAFELKISIVVGIELEMNLTSTNTGDSPMVVGGALHTYFVVGDIAETEITGLDQTVFDDKVSSEDQIIQKGGVLIDQEVDRVYLDTDTTCVIHDGQNDRNIEVSKSGSHTTVVWNPWIEKSQELGDFNDNGYLTMVCIEAVNAGNDVYELQPKQSCSLIQRIKIGN
ncbi:D-hexose-6-phosphate mutarotase [Echinimonas agarilytica]|uniref:Putative glucose-6-phosphate 1-epimerase n=1 Tax=Echinimonas agarilytica TaxID=1215918 RepID=A0AA42B637_9GAMM|nr:D-hexose-6-phosphate mutarotase [Echinimonas agarilytica]MCM2678280.1 D-hexose-6-phosphate mutarotase [Echinimonas agarilytica]